MYSSIYRWQFPCSSVTVFLLYDSMPDINIHVNGVAKLLRGLKSHKATGPDEVPARLLKEAADQLTPILTTVFRASYIQSTPPPPRQQYPNGCYSFGFCEGIW